MNILLLTSEFAPANGGIGTYAREIASAATDLGAEVTVIAPDYAQDNTRVDRSLPFEVRRFRGGLHSMRDLPSKILLARSLVRAERYDVVHAADWPFFIPVALSRRLTQARILMTVHGTEINETQTPLKRLAIRTDRRVRAANRNRRQQPIHQGTVSRAVCRRQPTNQRHTAGRIGFLVRSTQRPRRNAGRAWHRARPNCHGHGCADHPAQGTSRHACCAVRTSQGVAPSGSRGW